MGKWTLHGTRTSARVRDPKQPAMARIALRRRIQAIAVAALHPRMHLRTPWRAPLGATAAGRTHGAPGARTKLTRSRHEADTKPARGQHEAGTRPGGRAPRGPRGGGAAREAALPFATAERESERPSFLHSLLLFLSPMILVRLFRWRSGRLYMQNQLSIHTL